MKKIKVIQGPEIIYDDYDDNFCKELESIISIDGKDITINIEGTEDGFFISFKNKENRNLKDKNSIDFNEISDIPLEEGIDKILEKIAYATFYEQLGNEGDEYNSEEILSWSF
jgi:hypothetical protein